MIIGNYKIIKELSEGSFGRTYYAEHVLLKNPICLKEEITKDPIFMEWFKTEAKLLWDIHHPSLPTLKDYFEINDRQYIAMSFIEGDSLTKITQQKGFIDDEHICWILQRCLDALSYLHYNGVIHCDIKPENIILDIPKHNAIIVDFGMSSIAPGKKTLPKGGTEFYMPPEFKLGKPPIPSVDIYSLGKVALFLTGGNVQNNKFPVMKPELKSLIEEMIRQDPLARSQEVDSINKRIQKLRMSIWGRPSTKEEIKFR